MRASGSGAATRADVARAAGVSPALVSYVVNRGPRPVSAHNRERIERAISELGYRPSSSARALVTGRSRILGVIALDTDLHGPARILHSVERAARRAGYVVHITSLECTTRASVHAAADLLASQSVEGTIVIAPHVAARDVLPDLPATTAPMVAVGGGDGPLPAAAVDQYAGARLAVRHLLDGGAATVWHLAGPPDWLEATERERGWRDELAAAGRPAPPVLCGDWSPASGHAAAARLLATTTPDAVFVANDQMAVGVLSALRERGIDVPDPVRVVGFDDVPESAFYAPPLTTVRQDFTALGESAVDLLLARIGGDEVASVRLPPELVVRASSTVTAARPLDWTTA